MSEGAESPTSKGSEPSGYTQSNRFLVQNPSPLAHPPETKKEVPCQSLGSEIVVKGGKREEILDEHERKRRIYLELLRVEEALIERGFGKAVDVHDAEVIPDHE